MDIILFMKSMIDYKNVHKIGLVSRLNTDLKSDILKLKTIFDKRQIELLLAKDCAKSFDLKSYELDELFEKSDFIISLGGDGTLISLCRKAYQFEKALLGIHAGRLGFLTDFTINEAEAFFDEFFEGKFRVEEPFLLDIILQNHKGEAFEKTAFNDVVFSRTQKHSMAHIEVLRNGKIFNEYYGDGLILATPAGSTAYNLSANGPIIYTLAEVFLLTPVCSHSLTQRPIVLPKGFELEVRAQDCSFFIDGQECFEAKDYASIKIRLSDKKVKLLHPKSRDYFQILKEKLRWGN